MNGSAVIGSIYNQIAALRSNTSPSGNYRLGIYDDLSTAPKNLLGETASTALGAANDYSYINLQADAVVTTAVLWAAIKVDTSGGARWGRTFNASAKLRYYGSGNSYGAFTNPFAGAGSENGNSFIHKIKGV